MGKSPTASWTLWFNAIAAAAVAAIQALLNAEVLSPDVAEWLTVIAAMLGAAVNFGLRFKTKEPIRMG